MTIHRSIAIAAAALLAAAAPPAAAQPGAASILGMWMNPYGSVAVRTGACGDRLCGWIVWANAGARQDAREGGVAKLVGTALLEDYRATAPGHWQGTVFVPDMGRRFFSKIEQVDPDEMLVKGCILHGLICRSQTWRRIADVPHA